MEHSSQLTSFKETDYLIIGAGAMGIAFADELFTSQPRLKLTIVDRREKAGGHWNDAYPFVRLHQPAAFYGVNSEVLGNGSSDLSSKPELLTYYEKIVRKFQESGRVEFLFEHNYLGDGQVVPLSSPDHITTYKINKRLVDATYMKVEVPSTHAPKYSIDPEVPIIPINDLVNEYNQWENFYIIGNGKTGMDAILFLLKKGISAKRIYWICPNQAWLFNRASLQAGMVAKEVLRHAEYFKNAANSEEVFLKIEKTGAIFRINENALPKKWRCATVDPEELELLRSIKNVIEKGRVVRITSNEVRLQEGTNQYSSNTLFVDCSANALSKQERMPIFTRGKITLQSILFCQQVFSAATIAKLELTKIDDQKKNQIEPVPHPELTTDWSGALSASLHNLLLLHRFFPMWMFRARLNFMSHEPLLKYFKYATKAIFVNPALQKANKRIHQLEKAG